MPTRRARDQPLAEAFGRRLRETRLTVGLTQESLAHAAGLHPTFISNCERGYSIPTIDTLIRLARALEVPPGRLVDGLGAEV